MFVVADAGRAERIIDRQTSMLRNRSEQELAGYRDAQDYLFHQDWYPLNAGLILHLHRLLFAHTAMPGGSITIQCFCPDCSSSTFSSATPSRMATKKWLTSAMLSEHGYIAGLYEPRATRRRIG